MVHARRETKKSQIEKWGIDDKGIYRDLAVHIITELSEEKFNYLFKTSVKEIIRVGEEENVMQHETRLRPLNLWECFKLVFREKKRKLLKRFKR